MGTTKPWLVNFHSTNGVLNKQMSAVHEKGKLNYQQKLNFTSHPGCFRGTQLFITVNNDFEPEWLESLYEVGVTGVLISMSTFDRPFAESLLKKLQIQSQLYNKSRSHFCSKLIILEIDSSKICIGSLKNTKKKSLRLEANQTTTLTVDEAYREHVTEDIIFVDYEKLTIAVEPGDYVVFDKGMVVLIVKNVNEKTVECTVKRGGDIISNDTILIPGAFIELPELNKDLDLMASFLTEYSIDVVIMHGIQDKDTIMEIAEYLKKNKHESIYVLAAIDSLMGITKMIEISAEADGIYLDDNKLLSEVSKKKVFLAKKHILGNCLKSATPVLAGMRFQDTKTITKAEMNDLAYTILEGIDGIILSPENSNLEMVINISKICVQAEAAVHQKQLMEQWRCGQIYNALISVSLCIVQTAHRCGAAAIICIPLTGATPISISYFRPKCPIITVCKQKKLARHLKLFKCCDSILYRNKNQKKNNTIDRKLEWGLTYAKFRGYIRGGDVVIIVRELPHDFSGPNCIQFYYVPKLKYVRTYE